MMLQKLKAKFDIFVHSQSKEIKIQKAKKNSKFRNKLEKVHVIKIQPLTDMYGNELKKNYF